MILSPEIVAKARTLRKGGATIRAVAAACGIGIASAQRVCAGAHCTDAFAPPRKRRRA